MDDRAWTDLAAAVTQLKQELDEMRKVTNSRLNVGMVGDIEPTVRTTPKKGTLLLDGSTHWRADYPALWQWANDNGLVTGGLFGNGDGSTYFRVPDFRGRVPVGVGTLGSNTYAIGQLDGSSTRTLAMANMPQHNHDVDSSGHWHGISSNGHAHNVGDSTHGHPLWSSGAHQGHFPATQILAASGTALGLAAWNATGSWSNIPTEQGGPQHHWHQLDSTTHNHTGAVGSNTHTHTNDTVFIGESDRGSGTAFDNRQPSVAINWLIYY